MKAKISKPFGKRNRFNFRPNHESTLNFGSFFPCYQRELAPNETIKVDMSFFSRVAPMYVPTFGDLRVNFRGVFVPYSACWDYFKDFFDGKPSPSPAANAQFVNYTKNPYITEKQFIAAFASEGLGWSTEVVDPVPADYRSYDFCAEIPISSTAVEYRYYKFTKRGKDALRIFQSLGYNFSFCQYREGNSAQYDMRFDALPLIAFFHTLYSFYTPSQYKQTHPFRAFKQWLHDQLPTTAGVPITNTQLTYLFESFGLYYQPDYFTGAWEEPNSISEDYFINNGGSLDPVATGITGNIDQGNTVSINTEIGDAYVADPMPDATFSTWGLSLAQKMIGLLTKFNLVGSDWANRTLAQFGVKPVERLGVPMYLGNWSTQLKIDSVFDTAAVGENPLGSYAGRGTLAGKSKTFECTVKEQGLFMIIVSVEPKVSFTDGVDRHVLNESRYDYFNPTFDGLGMQAVATCEVFNTIYDGHSDTQARLRELAFYKNHAYAFQPRYAHLKYEKNRVTGDFNVRHLAVSVAPYSLQRNLFKDKFAHGSALQFNGSDYFSLLSIQRQTDAAQYNRIFAATDGYADPFFCLFDFNVSLESPMLPISESYEQYERKDQQIEVEKGGQYSN